MMKQEHRWSWLLRSAFLWWGVAMACPAVAAVQPIGTPDLPPEWFQLPPEVVEREAVKNELQESLPKKYRIKEMKVEKLTHGVGLDIYLFGDITPEAERDRPFADPQDRVRAVARAFLNENPRIFALKGPDVELVESKVNTWMGLTDLVYDIRIAGVSLYSARAHFTVNASGRLTGMDAQYPLLAPDTIAKIKAAVGRANISKEEVLAAILEDRRRTKPGSKIWALTPRLYRFVFSSPPYVRWRVGLQFEDERLRDWGFEVDGVTGEILDQYPPWEEREKVAPPQPP